MVARSRGQGDSRAARRLNEPRPVQVTVEEGIPAAIGPIRVVQVREEWRVVDRWWTEDPVDRRYFDLVLESGQLAVVYRDGELKSWWTQRA